MESYDYFDYTTNWLTTTLINGLWNPEMSIQASEQSWQWKLSGSSTGGRRSRRSSRWHVEKKSPSKAVTRLRSTKIQNTSKLKYWASWSISATSGDDLNPQDPMVSWDTEDISELKIQEYATESAYLLQEDLERLLELRITNLESISSNTFILKIKDYLQL
jgi:hypothetical protein